MTTLTHKTGQGWSVNISRLFEMLKLNRDAKIFISGGNKVTGYLAPITYFDIGNDEIIEKLMHWRNENIDAYLDRTPATFEGTRRWLAKFVLDNNRKILFLIHAKDGEPIGHLGLSDGLETNSMLEVDNIVKGIKTSDKGIMTQAVYNLISWVFLVTACDQVYLRVFSNNEKALKMYRKLQFQKKKEFGLSVIEQNGTKQYVLGEEKEQEDVKFIYMELSRTQHFENYEAIKIQKTLS